MIWKRGGGGVEGYKEIDEREREREREGGREGGIGRICVCGPLHFTVLVCLSRCGHTKGHLDDQ